MSPVRRDEAEGPSQTVADHAAGAATAAPAAGSATDAQPAVADPTAQPAGHDPTAGPVVADPTAGPAGHDPPVQPAGPPPRLLTEEEYKLLPGKDLQDLHDRLMAAPKDMTEVVIPVPPGIFLHDGSVVLLPFTDFKDFLHASGCDKWLSVGHITIYLMLVTKNCLYHVYSTEEYILMSYDNFSGG